MVVAGAREEPTSKAEVDDRVGHGRELVFADTGLIRQAHDLGSELVRLGCAESRLCGDALQDFLERSHVAGHRGDASDRANSKEPREAD